MQGKGANVADSRIDTIEGLVVVPSVLSLDSWADVARADELAWGGDGMVMGHVWGVDSSAGGGAPTGVIWCDRRWRSLCLGVTQRKADVGWSAALAEMVSGEADGNVESGRVS